ncbi:lysine-specific demethylase 8-like [Oppia nitens]|uniref:lysine-specific demethylase 8-like n=1 Tax=Oppia nitens TaxID=1686743 RepID=UPI0023DC2DA4|nr:lysine-specific demethylase 8-like [Oppia nitens]
MNEIMENNKLLVKQLMCLMTTNVNQMSDNLINNEIIEESIVYLKQSIEDYINSLSLQTSDCQYILLDDIYEDMDTKCEAILDKMWETINCCDWSRVVVDIRYCFALVSLLKAFLKIWSTMSSNDRQFCLTQKLLALKALDFGLLMSPKLKDNILAKMAQIIHKDISDDQPYSDNCSDSLKRKLYANKKIDFSTKRQNIINDDNKEVIKDIIKLNDNECELTSLLPYYKNINKNQIQRVNDIDFNTFCDQYLRPKLPVIVTDCMSDWPAMSCRKWSIDYIKRVAGYRTVPIEIGNKYTDEEWSQKLMTINDFIDKFIMNSWCKPVGYLAQHNLFDQIEELMADISIPDFCSITDEECVDVDINAWFGPKGTVSPLHYDPKDNIFAQMMGQKYIRLYSYETPREDIYPNDCRLLCNTSQVDLENVDLQKFPNFNTLDNYYECILNEGEMLFMPKNYWHFVKSLSNCFSISFWWK